MNDVIADILKLNGHDPSNDEDNRNHSIFPVIAPSCPKDVMQYQISDMDEPIGRFKRRARRAIGWPIIFARSTRSRAVQICVADSPD